MFRRRRRKLQSAQGSNSSPTQLMNLSLFIMLLAFFIVLNAISSFEEVKSKPILQSLEMTFSTSAQRPDIKPSVTPDPLKEIHEGDTIDRLDALFKAQLKNFDTTKSRLSGVMMVEVDLEEFEKGIFEIGQTRLTPQNRRTPPERYFLPTLVSILQSDQQGIPYRMDMIYHSDQNPPRLQNRKPREMIDVVDRVGRLAQKIEDSGMPQNLISVGVREGNPKKMTLFFRRHVPFSPDYDGAIAQ